MSLLDELAIKQKLMNQQVSPALAQQAQQHFQSVLTTWANGLLRRVEISGSSAKGTAVKCSADVDLFVSISDRCTDSLSDLRAKLSSELQRLGYRVREQNVALRCSWSGHAVDLTIGKLQAGSTTEDHSIWISKARTWQKTNVRFHAVTIQRSQRQEIIRVIKLWREKYQLDFPSLYLEMVVIRALTNSYNNHLYAQFKEVMAWIAGNIENARFEDPANSNNIISDDLTLAEKGKLKLYASKSILAQNVAQELV